MFSYLPVAIEIDARPRGRYPDIVELPVEGAHGVVIGVPQTAIELSLHLGGHGLCNLTEVDECLVVVLALGQRQRQVTMDQRCDGYHGQWMMLSMGDQLGQIVTFV